MKQQTLSSVSTATATTSDSKERRKEQNKAAEREIHGIFRGREHTPDEKAIDGLAMLGRKLQSDLEDQFNEMQASAGPHGYADREVARLIRMLEKRKDMLDQLHAAIAMDDALRQAAAPFLPRGTDAEN